MISSKTDRMSAMAGLTAISAAELVDTLGLVPHPEGGFFLETWRAGAEPMTTMGQTALDATRGLVVTDDRSERRPDGDPRRNALTSIFWVPTVACPRLPLAINRSDHVHYWQGGAAFEYTLFDPATKALSRVVLGPDLRAGQKLQVPVRGGVWKCGRLLAAAGPGASDCCIIGEAVGPGFDFHDFTWATPAMIAAACTPEQAAELAGYVHGDIEAVAGSQSATLADAAKSYDDTEERARTAAERL